MNTVIKKTMPRLNTFNISLVSGVAIFIFIYAFVNFAGYSLELHVSKPRLDHVAVLKPDRQTRLQAPGWKENGTLVRTVVRTPRLKPRPKPPGVPGFSADIYLDFNTSKYTGADGRIFIPSDDVLNTMTLDEVEELYYRYIENIQVICPRIRHIGNDNDGGYHVCEAVMPFNCLAYSFGNRRDYGFDDGLAFHYNCEVHSFDPDDRQPDHQHSDHVEFHKLGLGGKDEVNAKGWKIQTFETIRQSLEHEQRSIDLLKIDIEGGEWNSLRQMIDTGALEKAQIKLLIVEMHMVFTAQDLKAHLKGLHILKDLYNAGFRTYYFRIWSGPCVVKNKRTGKKRSTCHEVHFMKV